MIDGCYAHSVCNWYRLAFVVSVGEYTHIYSTPIYSTFQHVTTVDNNKHTHTCRHCVCVMAHYTPTQLFLREIKAQSNNGSVIVCVNLQKQCDINKVVQSWECGCVGGGPSQSESVSGVSVFMCVCVERALLKGCFNNVCGVGLCVCAWTSRAALWSLHDRRWRFILQFSWLQLLPSQSTHLLSQRWASGGGFVPWNYPTVHVCVRLRVDTHPISRLLWTSAS